MSKKISNRLLEKSLSAALLAIELYNKPNIEYREESFAILIINAYELLFKAKVVEDTGKINSIYEYEKKKLIDNTSSKRDYIKKNRIGEPMTKGIISLMNSLKNQKKISSNVIENILMLIEIRDNSIHFINSNNDLMKYKLYTVCVATIKNYYHLIEKWFSNFELSKYNFYITPINFSGIDENVETANLDIAQKNFINYLEMAASGAIKDDFDVCIKTELRFTKVETDEALLLKYAQEGKKVNVELSDEIFKKMYPLTYSEMCAKFKKKYGLKINNFFNRAKKVLEQNEICCKARYLNPNKKGICKMFYNGNFINKLYEQMEKDKNLEF
ncbi:MAG: DUF3644 domain-containing protein [Bacilli bacterium]|jgi:hypothetical protein|nr:DUF3644 domain-containing protein [Bacilli bacterium]MBR2832844.1 DUF3644 domain-containing protein [Bacilli bacterium]